MTIPETGNQNANPTIRDHAWLEAQLEWIWQSHFSDVARSNTVTIQWGRANRTRLGCIIGRGGRSSCPERSEIHINTLLQNPEIPESVIWQTIAHELAHYTHGFCSPHPQKYDHPHRGNVIKHELIRRQLGDVYLESERWLRKNWHGHVRSTITTPPKRRRRTYGKRTKLSLLSHLEQILTSYDRL